jgi:hypothetical protein
MVGVVFPALLRWSPISSWDTAPGLLVAGIGMGLLVVPLVNVVLAGVPARGAGGASGVFSTAQQLGGALSVAIIGAVFFGRLPAAGSRLRRRISGHRPVDRRRLRSLRRIVLPAAADRRHRRNGD